VQPTATLADIARQMRMNDSDSVAVMSDGKLIGIVTERDLVAAIADGVNPIQARADVVMSAEPATVGQDEEVAVVAMKMMRMGIRHLPLLDRAGQPIGLLSARDLVAALDRRN